MAVHPPQAVCPVPGVAAPHGAPPDSRRRWELDALRGLMLVLMTSTHLPTWFAYPASQPFGFVSAAEGFVFLSAYMAGLIFTRRAQDNGVPEMRRAFRRRALILYSCQAASLFFLFTIIAALGLTFHQPAANRLLWFYLEEPVTAFWASLMLVYNPALLDILPVYIIYMLLSPWVLGYALQRGWRLVIGLSIVTWAAAQFDLSTTLYDLLVTATGLSVPFSETGAFETYAWQLLWVFGMWLGCYHARTRSEQRRGVPRNVARLALGLVVIFLVWRHLTWIEPFALGETLSRWSDKWHLGPMRLLNFFALVLVLLHYGHLFRKHLPRVRWLETLGAASLPVFCAHLVLVLLALAVLGDSSSSRPMWFDPAMFVVCIALLHMVAKFARGSKSGPGSGGEQVAGGAPERPAALGLAPNRFAVSWPGFEWVNIRSRPPVPF